MAEISMVQMTGPAVSPGASAKEVQGSLVSDFSELLRDKGQSVSDGGKKTEVKRQETEQSQTHKPDKKVSVQEDEKQEANESASSPENTEEGLSVLAGMMMQQIQEVDAMTAEGATETVQTETILATENAEMIQMPEVQPVETAIQTAEPVMPEVAQAAQAVQPQDLIQPRQTVSQEPVQQEAQVENAVEQPGQAVQAAAPKPEQSRQEKWSFLKGVREGTFTVPGDGDVDFAPIFKILEEAGYQGWVVVEAEQDPAKANPFEYALKARKYIAEHTGL